jgi:carbamoylphosphate synthase large subunit
MIHSIPVINHSLSKDQQNHNSQTSQTSLMKQFKIVPLTKEYATKIREKNTDDFGHEVIRPTGYG